MNALTIEGMEAKRNLFLSKRYDDKAELAKDVIDVCRTQKKLTAIRGVENERQDFCWKEYVRVCDEHWCFAFSIADNKVSTSAMLVLPSGQRVAYPYTTWGSPGRRWDSELREFLLREVCKEG